jgi:hypothetical protein
MQDLLEAGVMNLLATEAVRDLAGGRWGLAVGIVLFLAMGLPLLIWPRKSTAVMWKLNQAMRPWRIRKPPFGVNIALGCFLVLLAAGFFVGLWATWR